MNCCVVRSAGAVVAALYGLGSICFILAVYRTSTANLVFILAFTSMFAALLSWIFLGERPRNGTLAAMAAMVVGVLIIVGDGIGSGNMSGNLLGREVTADDVAQAFLHQALEERTTADVTTVDGGNIAAALR